MDLDHLERARSKILKKTYLYIFFKKQICSFCILLLRIEYILYDSQFMNQHFQKFDNIPDMIKNFIAVLAISNFFLMSVHTQSCIQINTYKRNSDFGCDFFYINKTPTCSNFIFDKCIYLEFYIDEQTNQESSQNTTLFSLEQCTQQCCQESLSEQPFDDPYQYIQQCLIATQISPTPPDQSQNNYTVLIIVSIVLAFGLFFCLCLCMIKRCRKGEDQNQNPYITSTENHLNIIHPSSHQPSFRETHQIFEEKQGSQAYYTSLIRNSCPICLENRPNVKLSCSHMYHGRCIRMWADKKIECGICRAKDIDDVRIYCEGCFRYYYQTQLKKILLKGIEKDGFLCANCALQKEAAEKSKNDAKLNPYVVVV